MKKINSKPFCFFFVFLFFISNLNAQNVAISPNSKYFATTSFQTQTKDTVIVEKREKVKEKVIDYYLTQIDIYQIRSLNWIRSFQFKSRKKLKIEDMGFSYGGKSFFVKDKNHLSVWDVATGELVYDQDGECIFTFSNFSDFFVVFKDHQLISYNNQTGDKILEYKFTRKSDITKLSVTADDKYLMVSASEDYLYVYQTNNSKSKKRFRANDYRIVKNEDKLVILRIKDEKYYNYIYSLPNFERINYFFGYSTDVNLSDDGNYLAAFIKRHYDKVKEPILDYDALRIFDTETGFQWANIIDTDTLKIRLKNFTWLPKELISFDQGLSSSIYSIASDRFAIELDHSFEFDKNTSVNRQLQHSQISPSKRYVALQDYKGKTPMLYLRASAIGGSMAYAANCEFLDFTPNSQYIIVKQAGNYGLIRSADIEAIKDTLSLVTVHPFSSVLKLPIPEKIIEEDSELPEGYVHNPIKGYKHISSVPENELVNLYLKTIEVADSHTGLQVHLMDKEGIYYYGAGSYQWRHIWKNLLLQNEKGEIKEITNFDVVEFSEKDKLPTALAIVLDHSGSMGEKRAIALQKGAQIIIDKKEDNDALTIIKYDSNIGVEVPLSKTEKRLNKELKLDGIGKYGGATSLLDAIDRAVNIIKNAEGYKRKAVIILTDGNENSSVISKGQMLKSASANEVGIFTIGFGDFVSEEYLKALAFYTQGSSYQIFKTADFNWVFEDVYKKMRNYYSIRFQTDSTGVYSALLEIALDENRKDELATTFNNTPFDFDLLDESDFDYDFSPPIKVLKPTEFVMRDLTDYKDSIKTISTEVIKKEKKEKFEKQKEEFSVIKLPNIQFLYSEVKILKGSEKGIDEVVQFMNKYPAAKLEISGHTDNVGDATENKELSLARAKAVKMLLEREGINGNRIEVSGYGDSKPIATNETDEGRKQNRRVEFTIIE